MGSGVGVGQLDLALGGRGLQRAGGGGLICVEAESASCWNCWALLAMWLPLELEVDCSCATWAESEPIKTMHCST